MTTLTPEFFSRIQMAWTLAFHIIYPSFTIGLGSFILVMETLYIKTRNPEYLRHCKFWTKLFALTFGMGVVSGIVLSFELGLNWSGYTKAVGPVLGSFFTMEVLTAFFLEAGFLGIMIYGWNKVGPRLHYFATVMVVIGTWLSAFWILVANSWMQTPTGYSYANGVFDATHWLDVMLTPSLPYRFLHMLIAAWETSIFMVLGISAWFLLKKRHVDFAKRSFGIALSFAIVLSIAQPFMGDQSGMEVGADQPIKLAAMEGVWDTASSVPFLVFAWPDMATASNKWVVSIPYGASIIDTRSLHGTIQGLTSVAPDDRPYVPLVFFGFRIMVAVGMLLLCVAAWGIWLRWRGGLDRIINSRFFLRACTIVAPLGFLAIICGWITAESGRQPWIVYGILRTSEAATNLHWHQIITSLVLIVVVYIGVFGAVLYYAAKTIQKGPDDATAPTSLPGALEMATPFLNENSSPKEGA